MEDASAPWLTCTRSWTTDPDHACRAERLDGGDCCLVHAPDRTALLEHAAEKGRVDLEFAEITVEVVGELRELLACYQFDLNCLNAHFPDGARFDDVTFAGVAVFTGAHFIGLSGFIRARFSGLAEFSSARFEGKQQARAAADPLGGRVWFDDACFEADAVFSCTQIGVQASFLKTEFQRKAYFGPISGLVRSTLGPGDNPVMTTQFSADVTFAGSTFGETTDFSHAQFVRGANFARATFRSAVTFDLAALAVGETPGEVSFNDVSFDTRASFGSTLFGHGASFHPAVFTGDAHFGPANRPGLPGAVVNGHTSFDHATFTGDTDFAQARFNHGARFQRVTFGWRVALGSSATPLVLDRIRLVGDTAIELGNSQISLNHVVLREPLTITAALATDYPPRRLPGVFSAAVLSGSIVSMTDTTLLALLIIADGVTFAGCSLIGSSGLDHVHLDGDPQWPHYRYRHGLLHRFPSRRIVADEQQDGSTRTSQPIRVEPLYRQLRAGLEASKAAPAAADFYYGELKMRRLAAPRLFVERRLLVVYKWFGGYGVRAWRPFASYLAVIATCVVAFRLKTVELANDKYATVGNMKLHQIGGAIGSSPGTRSASSPPPSSGALLSFALETSGSQAQGISI